MFTGLVMSLGRVERLDGHQLEVVGAGLDRETLGASIAVNGCCLTVAELHPADPMPLQRGPGHVATPARRYRFDLLPATLERTALASLAPGDDVNLEPAMRAGDALGGHWVQGHVDAVGTVGDIVDDPDGRWRDLALDVPDDVLGLCVERGSLCVDGVSLTVVELLDGGVRVQLVPETLARTRLGTVATGARVNLEADVLARYVRRLLGSSHRATR